MTDNTIRDIMAVGVPVLGDGANPRKDTARRLYSHMNIFMAKYKPTPIWASDIKIIDVPATVNHIDRF